MRNTNIHEELAKDFENFNLEEDQAINFINSLFSEYKERVDKYKLYDYSALIPQNIIGLYYYYITKRNFEIIIQDYKQKYIFNESRLEDNTQIAVQKGLGDVYDFIRDYDFSKRTFNIFVDSMCIH